MTPDLFPILNDSVQVRLLLGSNPLRVYPWHRAPQNPRKPYATYGVISATPQSALACPASLDNQIVQVDIWSETGESCERCFEAIRNAVEGEVVLQSYSTPARDDDTELYRAIMEFSFWKSR